MENEERKYKDFVKENSSKIINHFLSHLFLIFIIIFCVYIYRNNIIYVIENYTELIFCFLIYFAFKITYISFLRTFPKPEKDVKTDKE